MVNRMGRRNITLVATIVLGAVALGFGGRAPRQGEAREIEILSEIVELRHEALEDLQARLAAGLLGYKGYAHGHAAWCEARAQLARAQGDRATELEARREQLDVLRQAVASMAHAPDAYETSARVEAEIAVLACELEIERMGEE